jgi:hypothetical protein
LFFASQIPEFNYNSGSGIGVPTFSSSRSTWASSNGRNRSLKEREFKAFYRLDSVLTHHPFSQSL